MMNFIWLASVFAAATAFTTQPNAFTTNAPLVGERSSTNGVAEQGLAHRNRRATIVMDGKANGESTWILYQEYLLRTKAKRIP
jgi:F-type H+-transporting ATPase subunit gamma